MFQRRGLIALLHVQASARRYRKARPPYEYHHVNTAFHRLSRYLTGIESAFPSNSEVSMIRDLQLTVGDICGDSSGLRVRVEDIDSYNRVHFSAMEENEGDWILRGETSRDAFTLRFTRLYSSEKRAA
jgi:hypothetical protein